ncbi:MAG: thioredoxin family protein, partial [Flavobacteriaceae bacterium]|nr:thioredoxin family protein [Flavobacteriaceae bacterium]
MKKYWEKGISFEEYFKKTEEIVNKDEEKLTSAEKEMLEYYKLGVQRMSRMMKV